jgi:hypothetical protein
MRTLRSGRALQIFPRDPAGTAMDVVGVAPRDAHRVELTGWHGERAVASLTGDVFAVHVRFAPHRIDIRRRGRVLTSRLPRFDASTAQPPADSP